MQVHDSHHCQKTRKRRVEVSWKCNRPGPGNGSRYSEQVLVRRLRRLRPTELCKVWLPGVVSALRSNLVQRLDTFQVPLFKTAIRLDQMHVPTGARAGNSTCARQRHRRGVVTDPRSRAALFPDVCRASTAAAHKCAARLHP